MLIILPDGQRANLDLIFNDCSIYGQFPDIGTFQESLGRLMVIRGLAHQFGRELLCHRNVAYSQVTPRSSMQSAVQSLSLPQRRAIMQWLQRTGPFWEDFRQHSGEDDLLEYNGRVVTDTAVGEAAYCLAHGVERSLVSLDPSCWLSSPLSITWHDRAYQRAVQVLNYWDPTQVRVALEAAPVSLESWKNLESIARTRCPDLTFASDSFEPLEGHPFGVGTAERLLVLLSVLQEFKNCFNERGERTPEGHALYRKHFAGEKAWFSDSADGEKSKFESGLTFPDPLNPGKWLFCTWHGKVKTPQLRIHFTWPVRANEPLCIVYVGPKITKR